MSPIGADGEHTRCQRSVQVAFDLVLIAGLRLDDYRRKRHVGQQMVVIFNRGRR